MPTQRSIRLALLLGLALILAGCAGQGGSKSADQGYKGQYRQFDLFLFPLISTGGQDNRLELYPGAKVEAWAFAPENDPAKATVPGPEIRVREGDTVEITFHIRGAPMPHTIHWHGLHVPWDMDGVPYVSQAPLGDRQFGGNGTFTYTYIFTINQSGTYWYHCHVDTQHHLDMGMYGPLIVEPRDPKADPSFDREATLMLDEWDKSHIHSSLAPDQIVSPSGDPGDTADALYGQLRDYYHMSTLTLLEAVYGNLAKQAPGPARDLLPPHLLRENRTWYPVTYPAYYATYDTFLFNGKAFPSTEPILVKSGETLRLRLIHAGSLVHSLHLHGHHFLVTHKDGYLLPNPYYADTLLMAPGERYDVYVKLDNPGPWMFHDHMPQYEQNDNIHPGGMMTMVCYQDGWAHASLCDPMRHHELHQGSGAVVDGLTQYFRVAQGAYVDPAYTGLSGQHRH